MFRRARRACAIWFELIRKFARFVAGTMSVVRDVAIFIVATASFMSTFHPGKCATGFEFYVMRTSKIGFESEEISPQIRMSELFELVKITKGLAG